MERQKIERLTETFVEKLRAFEENGELEALARLFADDAELVNPLVERGGEPARGGDGVRRFWRNYRAAFERIRSDFEARAYGDGAAGLFWRSRGKNAQGQAVSYAGATLLVFDGQGKIRRLRGYFDTRELAEPILAGAAASDARGYG